MVLLKGMDEAGYMTATEAAAELNVSVATLYAYVSRGIIQSEARSGTRARRYRAADVRALANKHKVATKHGDSSKLLSFGAPLLDSEITFTDGLKLYFRGRDASQLAANSGSLESVAALIWGCDDEPKLSTGSIELPPEYLDLAGTVDPDYPLVTCQALLPLMGQRDVRAYDLSREGASRAGLNVLRLVTALVSGVTPTTRPVHAVLSSAWKVEEHDDLLRSALILGADHELNASTFTVRVAASAGAPIYHAAAAGLATLQGARHGGEIERTYRLLQEILDSRQKDAEVVAGWMRRGESVPGFGHPLYPSGDPRAQTLLGLLNRHRSSRGAADVIQAVNTAQSVTGKLLNFDGALAALSLHLGLAAPAGLCILAIGRVVGWVGHAIEQYQDQRLIRPRARYVGLR
ncbi:citrate synthase family protein [Peteryoungia ipomoeae]|uniref:citrate synthase (unknown stereospecificity) n=1 Tax=Peteryoungia ipomoeae TaxID=1210932 RepID=A0A4S8NT42_9HYPH|nr:citrate synthase family protein [Peteryoungia ipomoeae]THV19731.1 helix-turn-helix domain-containing protein [Peteryoungia ipomoeae]